MTHRVAHALVMDTDGIPGRGGYAVVGLSDGVTPPERVFVAANFGISDYLHDPDNERAFYSFCRVPGGRYAFIRRFSSGKRRNETQNRLFVHTLFLDDALFDALHGLPWLLIDAKFRTTPDEPAQSLTTDGDRLLTPGFPALECELPGEVMGHLTARVDRVAKLLPATDPVDAIANVIAALQRGERALLPQGTPYELLTLLAWSMLPPADRVQRAWTQHDSMNVGVAFDIANVPAGATVDVTRPADAVARRLVEMNLESDESRRKLHASAAKRGLRIGGDDLRAWFAWHDAFANLQVNLRQPDEQMRSALEVLANSIRPDRRDPWVDSQEVLQLLWPTIQRESASEPAPLVIKRWESLLDRSGLGAKIFRDVPASEWLDRIAEDIGAELLASFFIFSTENDRAGSGTREAVARWLLARRGKRKADPATLARLTVRLAADRSALTEPLLEWLLDANDTLTLLAGVTPLNAAYGDLVLLATLVAIHKNHPQTSAYVRSALVPHLDLSEETRQHVSEALADAVAPILREDPQMFVRFVLLQPRALQSRLTAMVGGWMKSDHDRTLPVARAIVERIATATWPRSREADALVFALADAGDPAARWAEVLVLIANSADGSWFAAELEQLRASRTELPGLFDAVLRQLQLGSGPAMRTLLAFTRPAWDERIVKTLHKAIDAAENVVVWESIVVAAAKTFGPKAPDDVAKLLAAFWNGVEAAQVKNLGDEILDLTRLTGGAWRRELSGFWTPRIVHLPKHPQCQKLIDIINDSPEARSALFWRALDHRNATIEMFNRFDDDLWDVSRGTYDEQMAKAVDRFVAMVTGGTATASERAQRMIELAGNASANFAIRLVAERRTSIAMSHFGLRDWNALVKLPPSMLMRSGSAWMTLTRQLGGSKAEDVARDLETICRREKRRDGLDGIAAGQRDAIGVAQKMWERARDAMAQR